MRTANKLAGLSLGVLSLMGLQDVALAQAAQQPVPSDPRTQNSGALTTQQQSKQPPAAQNPGAADTATASSVTRRDQRYFEDLLQANVTEISAARLANAKAMSPGVREFGRHMLEDHSAALEKLKQLAQKKQMTLSQQPSADQQKMLDQLAKASSQDFDRSYLSEAGIKAHEETLALLKKIQKSGHDADLKMLAEELQPTVEAHLKMAQETAKKIANMK
jgi:putative membrane protein